MQCRVSLHLLFFIFVILKVTQLTKSEEAFCANKCVMDGVISFRSCFCDNYCWTLYGDCCADAKDFNPSLQERILHKRQDVICKPFYKNRSTYVITGCSSTWRGADWVPKKCQQLQNESKDPVGGAPVTNYRTGITYSNYYCAMCNDDIENIIVWQISVSCPFHPNALMDEDEARRRIFYNSLYNQWGYMIQDGPGAQALFYGCRINYRIPTSLAKSIRRCYPEEVSSCVSTWKNDFIKEMCWSYADPVFHNGTRYKNFYCAICNRVDQSQITCGEGMGYRTDGVPDTQPNMSFSLLLDINVSEGEEVGKRTVPVSCLKGEVFDPFVKSCRSLVCGIPGFVFREGRCNIEQ